jgi:hypothetical protein
MTTTVHVADRPTGKPKRPRSGMALKLDRTTTDARRQAAAILEVLAGVRTPTEAATALSLSLPAYYKLEARALRGMVLGCQPPGRGPRSSPEVEVKRLRRQCQQLKQEAGRYQALARAAQRAAGLPAPPAKPAKDARGRKRRKPAVRALRALAAIRQAPEDPPSTQSATSPPSSMPPAPAAAKPVAPAAASVQ